MDSNQNRPAKSEHICAITGRGKLDEFKVIATGGMSLIFRARQPSLERYIVVKKLKDELAVHPETVERFKREARALASVLHQNVAHVYDFVEEGSEPYILMEYIDGLDISFLIEKVGHLPPDVAVCILLGVAKGVAYIHTHRLIHRDIKPSNIRITKRGEVKLMDFGIVMEIENEGLTRPGIMVGSPSYLSPEQVLGDPITEQADIFLLGICLYEMLTGTKPFKDESNETIFQRIRDVKYLTPRKLNRNIPKTLDRIVQKCLKKNLYQRYSDVKSLILDLERFLGQRKTSHSEDVILKYVDNEALLTPEIPYIDVDGTSKKRALSVAIGLVAILLPLMFWFGYLMGTKKNSKLMLPTGFPPPKTLTVP